MRLSDFKASSVIVGACLVVSLAALVYSTNMHSDILFMKYLLDDISSGGRWSDWRFSPAPSYFPDLLIYFVAYTITKLVPLQIILTTAAQAIIIALLAVSLLRRLNPGISQAAKLAAVALVLLCVITTGQYTIDSKIGIFFGSNNIQVPTLISSLALLCLALGLAEKRTVLAAAGFVLIGALGFASSAIFIICFALPFLAAVAIIAVRSKLDTRDQDFRSSLFILSLFIASQIAGYALSKAITFNSPLDGRIPLSLAGAKSSFSQFLQATQFLFDQATHTAFLTACVFLATVVYGMAKALRLPVEILQRSTKTSRSVQEQMVVLFFLLTTGSSFFGAILSGGFIDKFGYRYFETFIAVSAVLAIYFIDRSLTEKGKKLAQACVVSLSVLATGCSIAVLEGGRTLSFPELLTDGAFKDQEQITAKCLDSLIGSGVPLKAGVADYWMARGVMYYMKNLNFISQSTDQLRPFFWISSIGYIRQPEKYHAESYNFVIADNSHLGHLMGFDSQSLKKVAPTGYRALSCAGTTNEVLYYPAGELDALVKEKQRNFMFSTLGRGMASFSGAELPGLIGHVNGKERTVTAADGSGILAYGPYISLPHGKFKAVLEYDAEAGGQAAAGRIEIGRFDENSRTILYSGDIPAGEHSLTAALDIRDKALERVEAHIIFNGAGKLTIKQLQFIGEQ
ncbi:hypothetical protein [Herbaspirillum frisingense]|uniref:hypothetical protein n=1 Tax=Herbaspirillum frisingense TaxID=92645 RepID=UPI0039B1158E